MATHDYVIDNSTGANVRADLNLVLQAILSNNSSSSAPSTTAAYMWWADTTTGILKIRNSANNAWVELLQLDGTLTLEDGSASTPALAFRDDLNTGIFSSAADTFNVATGGVERMELGAATIFNEDGADVDFRIEGDTNANLFYVNAGTDRIGINSLSPSAKLEISHGGSELGLHTTGAYNFQAKFESTDAEAAIIIEDNGSTNDGNRIGVISDAMAFTTANSERLRIDSSGNVGIGTTSPRRHFHIHEPSSATVGIMLTNAGTGESNDSQGFQFKVGSDGTANIDQRENQDIVILTNATERMRIDSSGKLIVGTNTSRSVGDVTAQIQLEGTGFASSSLSLISNAGASAGNTPHLTLGKSRGSSDGSNTIVVSGDALGQIQFSGADGTDCNTVASSIIGRVDGTPGSNDMPGNLTFNTTADGAASPTERLRIDSSGNVGIGSTSPTEKLEINLGTDKIVQFTGGIGQIGNVAGVFAVNTAKNEIADFGIMGNTLKFASGTAASGAERMRIGSDGFVGIGVTGDVSSSTGMTCFRVLSDNRRQLMLGTTSSSARALIEFFNSNGGVGSINTTGSSTAYNTSSDYRLKENITAISDGITRLKTLKPSRFNFKVDASTTVDGFIAHEVTAVPEAISGTKDEVDSDNNPVYQGIDQSKIVPLLVAAVQELITKVETLESA